MIEVTTPIARTNSGKVTPMMAAVGPFAMNAAAPRMIAATSVTSYDSNRSAAMPAQSPTLSPTLSAIVAALRGSSSGISCSTLPTRSAPTSAAFVKMPPPTRMNIARSAPPKPNPISTSGASSLNSSRIKTAPSSPSPTVNMPATPPARNAIVSARRRPDSRAALATRTFARTASDMPANPVSALNPAPSTKASERPRRITQAACSTAPPTHFPPISGISFAADPVPWMHATGAGRMKNSTKPSTTTKAPTVVN